MSAHASLPATSLLWSLPFVGMLLSIAVFPIVAPRFWRRRMGWVAAGWSTALLLPQAFVFGITMAAATVWHAVLIDYLPFVTLLLALYTTGGGVLLIGGPAGSPSGNTAMLAFGIFLSAMAGTTAASMVLIHPLLHANAHRRRKFHLVLFLIILVANVSGALTPLGNPPLYIGFLHGVPFFWPSRHLAGLLMLVSGALLAAFYLIDRRLAARETAAPQPPRFRIRGRVNIAIMLLVIAAVLLQGQLASPVELYGVRVAAGQLAAIAVFLAATAASIRLTPRNVRQANDFTWQPMAEVAKLFAAIFVTIGPVTAMLQTGLHGPFAPLLRLTRDTAGQPIPLMFFWLTGILSAFLDNAPTYLVFFNLAGIRPGSLDNQAVLLAAISAGAVFFGGLTYVGNAPNMMLRAIAAHRGVRMPGFFGFMLRAAAVLVPILVLTGALFF